LAAMLARPMVWVPMRRTRFRLTHIAFGVWLAGRGRFSKVILGLSAVAAVGSAWWTRMHPDAWRRVPFVTSAAVAWGLGAGLAYAVALRVMSKDVDQGVVALARTHGAGSAQVVLWRMTGLSTLLALSVGGPTLISGLAAVSVSPSPYAALRETISALVYALGFSAVMGPLAIALLGGRSQAVGYLLFVAVLTIPEALSPWTRAWLPGDWPEMTSIPSALNALRGVIGGDSPGAFLRAAAGLTVVGLTSALVAILRAETMDGQGAR
jgi:hypothetical protein